MNSTTLLIRTSPLIHRRQLHSSRIPEPFAPFRYHLNTTNYSSSWKLNLQISRTSNSFNTKVYAKNPITREFTLEESTTDSSTKVDFEKFGSLLRCGFYLGLLVFGVIRCQKALALDVGSDLGFLTQGFWNGPKIAQILRVFREQGLILAALLGLFAFFSMAEISITTLSPWKVRELAKKEDENGVFKLLRTDITRFLTTILIGTT